MAQLPNNSSAFPPAYPTASSFGQTFHKQNFETTGETIHLNVNNDNDGVWTGGIGGFNFSTINSTLTDPIELLNIDPNGLTITTALRNTSNKTILDLTNNQLTLTDALGTSQTVLSPNSLEMSNDPDGVKLGYTNQAFYAFTPANDTRSNLYAGVLQQGNPSDLSNLTPTYLQINKRDNTLTSTLNNTSLNITNTTTTKTAILTDSNLTFNGVSYAQNQVVPTLIYSSPLIYADGIEPANGLGIRTAYAYSGWYFKNTHGTTGGKINWYFPAQTQTSTTVADLKGIAISFFNGQTVSNDDTLFITVLTNLTGTNDYAPGFFHSSMTYVFNQAITPIANTNYQGVCIVDKNIVPFNFETQIQYEPSTVNNPRGDYAQNDTILAVVIGTNSASVKNSVELVVNKLNLIYSNFTQSYLLVPP